jgi:Ni,Fe-hydrogenase III component G
MAEYEYPESEKLSRISLERQVIDDFVEWLGQQNIRLCSIPAAYEHTWMPISRQVDSLVMEMWGIDPVKLEQERREMLRKMREMNDG